MQDFVIDRRTFLAASAAAVAGCARAEAPPPHAGANPLDDIRAGLGPGVRLGVAALDTGSGRRIGLDEDSRYPMCSTFKAPLAAAVLVASQNGLALTEELPVTRADLVAHAPAVEANLARGRMRLDELCAAIVEVSDNAAANILLRRFGGPRVLTAFMRRMGDRVSRLDRYEPELNYVPPGDVRDTTSPAAMLRLMRRLLLGDMLNAASRARLVGWMENSSTGLDRLRGGFPAGWRAGDKTGTGNGSNNDVAIAWPGGGRAPILIASYMVAPDVPNAQRNAAHAAVARAVVSAFA